MADGTIVLQEEITNLQKKLDGLTLEYGKMLKNPKVYRRQMKIIGSKITKVNYSIGNKMMELSNNIESIKR